MSIAESDPEKNAAAGPEEGAATDLSAYGTTDQFEMGRRLRNLMNRGGDLAVMLDDEDPPPHSKLVDVDPKRKVFWFQRSLTSDQDKALQELEECHFEGLHDGARVIFSTGAVRVGRVAGQNVFEASFPKVLYFIQRREYFRIEATLVETPLVLRGGLGDNSFQYKLKDISLGGVGLVTDDRKVARWLPGGLLEDVELDLRDHGRFKTDMQIMSVWLEEWPDGKRWYHVGLHFRDTLSTANQGLLMRCITHLELLKNKKTAGVVGRGKV